MKLILYYNLMLKLKKKLNKKIKEFEEELYNDALDGGDVIFYSKP